MTNKGPRPGSAAYARMLAGEIEEGLAEKGDGPFGISDGEACVLALRYHAGRHLRVVKAGALAAGFLTLGLIGLPDRNGDGRVDFGDLAWRGSPKIFGRF